MKLPFSFLEQLLVYALGILTASYGDKLIEVLARVGDKLNDKIEGTETQLDDMAKVQLVAGLQAMIDELKVDGVDT